jgi:NAD(P)-dependent dehydrogenase (short-subunit alcohol dehydrogenase family)
VRLFVYVLSHPQNFSPFSPANSLILTHIYRVIAQCQSAITEALLAFTRIDVLLICTSEALIGCIEELSQSTRAMSLVRDQFESNFFAPVNLVKAVLPGMREQRGGHIVAITGISERLLPG